MQRSYSKLTSIITTDSWKASYVVDELRDMVYIAIMRDIRSVNNPLS